ncbi:MAG: hypothetical protein CMH98_03685 [Oceanospirillaceae bacterium]|nr:hypothetical protein [Oceanospirillaceae bacterium]
MGESGTGITIWEGAVKHAREQNAEEAEKTLLKIGRVEAIYPAPGDKWNALTQIYTYPEPTNQLSKHDHEVIGRALQHASNLMNIPVEELNIRLDTSDTIRQC